MGFAVLLCALPLAAQIIPAGDDPWDTVGGGATTLTLSSADWAALCGVQVPDTAVQLKGFNIPGQGTADVVVAREGDAVLLNDGDTASVPVRLKKLSLINDGTHPCSPGTLRVTEAGGQQTDTMTITRTSAAGGEFTAVVPVTAVVTVTRDDGTSASTVVSGSLGDQSPAPWSYNPPSNPPSLGPWYPGVDPVTLQRIRICRFGRKILPAFHCYRFPPKCKVLQPAPTGTSSATATGAIAVETCTVTPTEDTGSGV